MTIEHQHHCKFCGTPITLKIEQEGLNAFEGFSLEFLKSIAACNRCADYREKKRAIEERLAGLMTDWARDKSKQVRLGDAERKNLLESIEFNARKYSELVHRFYRIKFEWDPAFVQLLMERPDRTMAVLALIERMISRPACPPPEPEPEQPELQATHPDP